MATKEASPRAVIILIFVSLFGILVPFITLPRNMPDYGYSVVLCWVFNGALIYFAWSKYHEVQTKELLKKEEELLQKEKEYELWCNSGSPEEKIVQSICDAILREHDWDGLPRIKVRVFTHVPDIITYFRKENIRNGRKIHFQYIKVQQECLRHLDAHEIAEDMKVALIQVWSEWTNNESPLVKETKAIEVGVRT